MSQVSIVDIEGNNPQIPTQFDANVGFAIPIANVLEIYGATVPAGTVPVQTVGSGNNITTNVQISQAIASSNASNIGLSAFDSNFFTVDANGFVSILGGSTTDSFNVDAHTAPGTDPVLPDGSGIVTVTGAQVASGVVGTNIIRTNSLAVNTYTIEIQRSTATAASTIASNGVAHFNSSEFTVDANGFVSLIGGGQAIDSFTTDVLGPVTPDGAGNVAFTGATNIFSDGSVANTMRLNLQGTNHALYVGRGANTASDSLGVGTNGQVLIAATAADPTFATVATNANMNTVLGANSLTLNPYNCAKWIVDPTANLGTHQTITAAIAAASSGDTIFIRPGTYTENLSLKPGVNLVAFDCDALTPNVTIIGKLSFSSAGDVSISGVRLKTNSDNFLAVTGSAASIVNLERCYLDCSNNTGISFTSSSSSSSINILSCLGNIGTTGIGLFAMSSVGVLSILYTIIDNRGGSSFANTASAGFLLIRCSRLSNPINSSSTNSIIAFTHSIINTESQNVTALTVGGAITSILSSNFHSGSASAISVQTVLLIRNSDIDSSNANAITGTGFISYGGLTFKNSRLINTTTQSGGSLTGIASGTAPSVGYLGEQIRSAIGSGSPVALPNLTPTNITSISCTPGVWDISGIIIYSGSVTGTSVTCSLSTTSATPGTSGDNLLGSPVVPTGGATMSLTIPSWRQTFSSTTTVYLVANQAYTSGTMSGWGRISATRVG